MSGRSGHRRGGQTMGRWKGWGGLGPEAPAPGARMPRKRQPMTERQRDYLERLCESAGEPFNPRWTRQQASRRIDALKGQPAKGRPA